MGEWSNFFGSLADIDIINIDFIMSVINPDINMKNYCWLLLELYRDLEHKMTGCV